MNEKFSNNQAAMCSMAQDFESFRSSLFIIMRFNPTGCREWIQHFENYMASAVARRGLGYLDFILY
jgi:hypothetical protein